MCASGSLKHTVDLHPSIKFPVLKPCNPVHNNRSGRDYPAIFTVKGNGFLERGKNVGTER
jgi:hypothetical protein